MFTAYDKPLLFSHILQTATYISYQKKILLDGEPNMMIFSAKITKAKLLSLALICACVALILLVSIPRAAEPTLKTEYSGATNEERVNFLRNFGWEIVNEPAEIVEVVIPETFDSTYSAYNDLQKTQGMNLENYKGMRAVRYTYSVKNYPKAAEGEGVEANLLVVDKQIVAGDVTSVKLGGFMQGLARPAISTGTIDSDGTPRTPDLDPIGK